MEFSITIFLDLLGTFAFAISGLRLASGKRIDWFGAFIIALVTAIGGGTTRDLLLDVRPFWMMNPMYFITTGIAFLSAILFKEKLFRWGSTLFMFDAIGLGLFTVVGISKSLAMGLPFWVCVMMGTITGTVGGVFRDVLLNKVPLVFTRDIYALACVFGGGVYYLFYKLNFSSDITELMTAITVIIARLIAAKFHLQLPLLKPINETIDKR
ncbi:trimeric intracellular cation channel family protein [Galbibacter sp.]|uniref:trimeric intracellular cation channel family protein n=1 Tax=Galbibacter sp. TaxID=2918471 RepID=UPI002BF33F83|nr:trimeric intracellular cation channel family protein [Galbibacter sp.]HLV62607.1 trimeric intracellular cation channel family protein [Galbibacter sp.]